MPPPTLQRLRTGFHAVLIAVFLAGIFLPLARMLLRGEETMAVRRIENRIAIETPVLKPTWESIRTFPDRYEAYINDRFGFRDLLIDWHNRVSCFLLNTSPTDKVKLGQDGWLFFNGDAAAKDPSPLLDYSGLSPMTEAHLERLRYLFHDQHDYLQSIGIRYLFAIIPSKPFIYPEYLPTSVPRRSGYGWRTQLADYLRRHTPVTVLDLGPAVAEAAAEEQAFFKTDTHWTHYGGYRGVLAIVRVLRSWYPVMEPVPAEAYIRTADTKTEGDLVKMMGLQGYFAEPYLAMIPGPQTRSSNQFLSEDKFAEILGGTGDPALPRAKVYRDSFSEYVFPYLSEYFEAVSYEWGQSGTHMRGLEQQAPDVVIQIMCDRILDSEIFTAERVSAFGSRRRFERGRVEAVYTNADGYEGLVPASRNTGLSLYQGDLIATAQDGRARVRVPLRLDTHERLPILRLEIRPPEPSVFTMSAPTRDPVHGVHPPEVPIGRKRLERGRNVFHFTLPDPAIRDHITLDLGETPGSYVVYAVELRSVPRFEP